MTTLIIDGSHGEGGGQIVRSSLTLAVLTRRPIRLINIRARRPKSGLAAQHLSAVRAAEAISRACVSGAELASRVLEFKPDREAQAGDYEFDVAEARMGGSAGSATLVLQTVLVPLALTTGSSTVTIRGGTHVAWSPPADYIGDVWLPLLATLGIRASLERCTWGFYPVGKGSIAASTHGRGRDPLQPLNLTRRGKLRRVVGRAVAAKLPAHIPSRMAERARGRLRELGAPVHVAEQQVRAACPGAGIFLTAEYEQMSCGFSALGRRGKPAEKVADEAIDALIRHSNSGAALDVHLADQILLALSLANGESTLTAERGSGHLETNAWVIERFGIARVSIDESVAGAVTVRVIPASA